MAEMVRWVRRNPDKVKFRVVLDDMIRYSAGVDHEFRQAGNDTDENSKGKMFLL